MPAVPDPLAGTVGVSWLSLVRGEPLLPSHHNPKTDPKQRLRGQADIWHHGQQGRERECWLEGKELEEEGKGRAGSS